MYRTVTLLRGSFQSGEGSTTLSFKRASTGGALGWGAGVDASDLAAEREWGTPGCGRRGGGDGGRVEQGDEAEEGPSHKGAMRARREVEVAVQGVQRLSAREEAL